LIRPFFNWQQFYKINLEKAFPLYEMFF
jgi:hypothetical protein